MNYKNNKAYQWLLMVIFGVMLVGNNRCQAKVLFLAHWNEHIDAEYAEGNPAAVFNGGSVPPQNSAGYPYQNSMPAISGLGISKGSVLAYETSGNINPEEGTIDCWFYSKTDFEPGRKSTENLFRTNDGIDKNAWKSFLSIAFRGWSDKISFVTRDENKEGDAAEYLTHYWRANTKWHRIAATWSRSKQQIALYIDGRLVERKNNVNPPETISPYFFIGSFNGRRRFSSANFDELRILDRPISEVEAAVNYCRKREFTKADTFNAKRIMHPIDISAVATTPFEDDQANDHKGGWTDQGSNNDMKKISRGDIDIFGIPFTIGDGCIVLANAEKQYYPQQAVIDINAKYGGLLFLHTAAWLMAPDRTPGQYIVTYADGTTENIPIKAYDNIADWWYLKDLPNARPAPIGNDRGKGAFVFFWHNPHVDKIIRSVTFKSNNDEAMPILLALTGVNADAGAAVYEGLSLLTEKKSDIEGAFTEAALTYHKKISRIDGLRDALAAIRLTAQEMTSFYGREASRHLVEANIYLKELSSLKPGILSAIATNDFSAQSDINKSLAYLHYIKEILQLIPKLQVQAHEAKLMEPVKPEKIVFPSESIAFLNRYQRQQIVLNGVWEYSESTRPDNCGGKKWTDVIVPFLTNPDKQHKDAYWLRKKIAVPPTWKNKRVSLRFEDSRYITEVYINRKYVARHIGIEPFDIDISDHLTCGAVNELLVLTLGKRYLYNSYNQGYNYIIYQKPYPHFGIRQDVLLNVANRVSIIEPFARVDTQDNFILTGTIANWREVKGPFDLQVKVSSANSSHDFGTFKITPDEDGRFTVSKFWSKPIMWGIGGKYGRPELVFVNLVLSTKGHILDKMSYRTGFSRIEVLNKIRFYLNGEKIIMQGDCIWAGEGHNAPATRSFMNRFYRISRGANFNLLRSHHLNGGNINNVILDTADELGSLVMPEGSGMKGSMGKLLNGNMNYDDPVLRKNGEAYYRAFARKIRTHPCVVIFALENEVFQGAGSYIQDALKYFLHMEKIVAREMPGVILTESGSNWRKEFSTVDLHYSMGSPLKNWKQRGDRPLIHSEWSFYEGGYFGMSNPDRKIAQRAEEKTAQRLEDEIKFEIANGVAATLPFPAYYMYGFSMSDESLMGPFADILMKVEPKHVDRWYMPDSLYTTLPVKWPALSGRGVKIRNFITGTQADNINFFDEAHSEFTPNKVYYALQRAFTPMPALRQYINPEVIVHVNNGAEVYPVWASRDSDTSLSGVMPDKQGKAWFELPVTGSYSFIYFNKQGMESKTFEACYKPLTQKPGFDYIDHLELEP